MGTLTTGKPEARISGGGGGHFHDGFGEFGWSGGPAPGAVRRTYRTGMWLALLTISMVFVAFTSAYIVRSGLSDDWHPIQLPPLLWWNTLVLLASSVALQQTQRALNHGLRAACNRWLTATFVLGVAFLAGQLLVWRQLASYGIYMVTNPSSSFFYVLTGVHGIHLLGGLGALFYIAWEGWRYRLGPAKRTLVEVTAMYWHFLGGLWIYILLLLWLWR